MKSEIILLLLIKTKSFCVSMFDNEISFHLGENELKGSIDINSDIITIDESDYKPSIYSIEGVTKFTIFAKEGRYYQDLFSFYDIPSFPIIFFERASRNYPLEAEVGLYYDELNKNRSILYSLKTKNKIDSLSYYLTFRDNKTNSLCFGSISNDILKVPKTKKGICINSNQNNWGCNLTSLIFNNKKYLINQSFIIDPSRNYFQVSERVFNLIFYSYLDEQNQLNKCRIDKTYLTSITIICDCDSIANNPPLIFEFGEY